MPIFAVLIVVSFSFYLYFKIKSVRSHLQMEKKWISGKSSIALGLFVAFFGINQLFLFQSTTTYIVSSVFILIGAASIFNGYKMYKYYLPFAIDEAEQISQQKG